MKINVINRSDDTIVYNLPETVGRRVYTPFQVKEVDESELNELVQTDGGEALLKDYLLVDNKEWVEKHLHNWAPDDSNDAPLEYFWKEKEIKECVLNDSIDLFQETLDYAPDGVINLIKYYSYTLPITDMNKMKALLDKTGFDVAAAIELTKKSNVNIEEAKTVRTRLRK